MSAAEVFFLLLSFTLDCPRQVLSSTLVLPATKIVGGNETTIEKFPYAVSIRDTFYAGKYEKNICCGSIISEDWVLTSAHCVNGYVQLIRYLAVRVGKPNNNQGILHSVLRIVVHPDYTYNKVPKHNIAVLKVTKPFVFSIRIQPVKFASADFVADSGTLVTVVGWGASQEGGNDFDFLHEVSVPIISKDECDKYYEDYVDYDGSKVFGDDVLCAGSKEGHKGFCENDNGGPLVSEATQVGVVSWSWGCGYKDFPGVYTNVSVYSQWISSATGVGLRVTTTTSPTTHGHGSSGVPHLKPAVHSVMSLTIPSLYMLNALNILHLLN